MYEVVSMRGEIYSYDPETDRIFKDGQVMSSVVIEPVFSSNQKNIPPRFSGFYLKNSGTIISLSGKISTIIDSNMII